MTTATQHTDDTQRPTEPGNQRHDHTGRSASGEFGEHTYGDGLADVYDYMYPVTPAAKAAGEYVARLAGPGGTALELGIGTGRVGAFTAAAGVQLTGVDASQRMLDKLHELHPDSGIRTRRLDFTSESTGETFDVVYVPLSTFFVARTLESQLRTMRLMREQVAPGGDIVIEAFDPRDYHAQQGTRTETHPFPDGSLMIDTTIVERTMQLIVVSHTTIDSGRHETVKEIVRYAFPAELDLMARLAGLELVERSADWAGTSWNAGSLSHVSRYRVADPDTTPSQE
ncbi:Methyltransferase domain-containing protein [Actinopolyspora xinjiangensis]|uniref:Methyltransferase domain-containing protein n=1 Tax=Actinopolyspora xinjiangensis TaxID=405564 RepID=A0A1H0V9L0_9ACTN|nr:class I SAM-dependent methyltransferase [Actinopolyspora xinjiangensis]SDP74888.1 Methyltransferase domain-containing protein [Actinopolyspora xinjiangensis]